MNKQQTLEAIKVMQAFVAGEEIQYRDNINSEGSWSSTPNPLWDWHMMEYRAKPVSVKLKLWHKDGECMTYKRTDDPDIFERRGWRLIEVEEKMK